MSRKPIYTDRTIYREQSKQFPKVRYRYSLANPVIHRLYVSYLSRHGIPKRIGLTDKQREDFESKVQKLIDSGMIVVQDNEKRKEEQ